MEACSVGSGPDGDVVFRVFDRRLGCPLGVLGFDGRDHADLTVEAAMVEPVGLVRTAISTSRIEAQPPFGRIAGPWMNSDLNSELNASARALSYESPLEPTEAIAPASASRSV